MNATTMLLEPLHPEETDAMVASLGWPGAAVAGRIREAAEGNPLFVEQMVALMKESGNGDVVVPPTIHALLAARLDQLDLSERAVLERGSVEGRVFHRRVVEALGPDDGSATIRLTSLVRKEFIRPDKPVFPGDDAFRFRHVLIRDTAYDAMPKAVRADLHERFAEWLETNGHDIVELDDLLGYHLEQAYSYHRQLGATGEAEANLAKRAAGHLGASGRRAFGRGDAAAALRLLERATELLPPESPQRLKLLPTLGSALTDVGAWDSARVVLSEAAATAQRVGDRGAAADAIVALAYVEIHTDAAASHAKVRADIEPVFCVFEELGDYGGLARALNIEATLRFWRGDNEGAIEALERAARHAREAGDRTQEHQALGVICTALLVGPTPVPDALERLEKIELQNEGAMRLRIGILRARAGLEAMRGRFAEAREVIGAASSISEDLGLETVRASGVLRMAGEIELLAGDGPAAERFFLQAWETLEERGDWGHLASVAPLLAQALLAQGRMKDAARPLELAPRWIIEDDSDAQILFHRAKAKLAALTGDAAQAEALARRAVERSAEGDGLNERADALVDLAEVLELDGRHEESTAALRDAVQFYERKGNLVAAQRVRRRIGLRIDPRTGL
jgi:tetratricopeptide (TPR) repeat protein